MRVDSGWFIAPRVRRLSLILSRLPARQPGLRRDQLIPALRPHCDGPRQEIPLLVDVLLDLGLAQRQNDRIQLSQQGQRGVSVGAERWRKEMTLLIIQAGFVHDQVRQLLELSTPDLDGSLRCPVAVLRQGAPQLVGLLRAWPGVVGRSFVVVPAELVSHVDVPWSLIPLATAGEDGVRKAVGSRAEAYSFHYLRSRALLPGNITWVALDDERLGYDIEDRSHGSPRRVEVKASRAGPVRFFLSENEYAVAHSDPSTYEIHFWGQINLSRDPNSEFADLISRGYPRIYQDLARHLANRELHATAIKWRVVEPI